MGEALIVRFRSDSTNNFKGFSASYVSVDPFEGSEEENGSESSETVTPFPGYLKSVYANKLDNDDEEEEEHSFYNQYDNYNVIKRKSRKKKSEVSKNG